MNDEIIKKTIISMVDTFNEELYNKTQDELEEYWYFKYDNKLDVEANTYQFYSLLKLYESFCEQWEEKHHGSVCIVERVRDKYLLPKIKKFWRDIKQNE